ncbi:MAG TPA: hypothetical protein VK052_12715 [Zeimonas sp.]|nr:hypothetical protein [Zeimonas sp.]
MMNADRTMMNARWLMMNAHWRCVNHVDKIPVARQTAGCQRD